MMFLTSVMGAGRYQRSGKSQEEPVSTTRNLTS